ncbi:Nicotinamidase-related amidase [Roseateles sp. YR242]|uniref:isochorismatase family protein n=1 Tax=Roseateles sp. YR242 TaxID=1855305 RepID=UPI0008D540E2|nr:isochorismatase family protein [Roseateles sp. YR242]SEL83748.1 Nicotinamidase-related amidase [Roseateles sp. YR242]
MTTSTSLLTPQDCCVLLVDPQPGLAFAVQSTDRQLLLNNLLALGRTASAFSIPLILSTSATKVYSGPTFAVLRQALPDIEPIDRRSMNAWEDDAVRSAVQATGRKTIILAGLLTEACVSFPALSAVRDGYRVLCVADACGGATVESHRLSLDRLRDAGVEMTSWLQFLLELQRDWTRHETYDAARAIVEAHAGGYGIGLSYARDMIKPPTPAATPSPASGA